MNRKESEAIKQTVDAMGLNLGYGWDQQTAEDSGLAYVLRNTQNQTVVPFRVLPEGGIPLLWPDAQDQFLLISLADAKVLRGGELLSGEDLAKQIAVCKKYLLWAGKKGDKLWDSVEGPIIRKHTTSVTDKPAFPQNYVFVGCVCVCGATFSWFGGRTIEEDWDRALVGLAERAPVFYSIHLTSESPSDTLGMLHSGTELPKELPRGELKDFLAPILNGSMEERVEHFTTMYFDRMKEPVPKTTAKNIRLIPTITRGGDFWDKL